MVCVSLIVFTLSAPWYREGGANETVLVYALYFNTTVDNATLLDVAEEVLRMERDGRIIIGGKMYNITHYTGIFRTFNATFSGTDGEMKYFATFLKLCSVDIVDQYYLPYFFCLFSCRGFDFKCDYRCHKYFSGFLPVNGRE